MSTLISTGRGENIDDVIILLWLVLLLCPVRMSAMISTGGGENIDDVIIVMVSSPLMMVRVSVRMSG